MAVEQGLAPENPGERLAPAVLASERGGSCSLPGKVDTDEEIDHGTMDVHVDVDVDVEIDVDVYTYIYVDTYIDID